MTALTQDQARKQLASITAIRLEPCEHPAGIYFVHGDPKAWWWFVEIPEKLSRIGGSTYHAICKDDGRHFTTEAGE